MSMQSYQQKKKLESTIWVLIIFQLNIELLYMKILVCEKGKVFEGIATAVNTGYMMMMGGERGQAWVALPLSISVSNFFLLQLSMKVQLTIKKKGNFIWTRLRVITRKRDSQKALRNCSARCKLKAQAYTFLRQRITHQNDMVIFYTKFTKDASCR